MAAETERVHRRGHRRRRRARARRPTQRVDGVILVNTTGLGGESLAAHRPSRRTDFIDFFDCGAGLVGIHAAADSGGGWPEYDALLGSYGFDFHPHFSLEARDNPLGRERVQPGGHHRRHDPGRGPGPRHHPPVAGLRLVPDHRGAVPLQGRPSRRRAPARRAVARRGVALLALRDRRRPGGRRAGADGAEPGVEPGQPRAGDGDARRQPGGLGEDLRRRTTAASSTRTSATTWRPGSGPTSGATCSPASSGCPSNAPTAPARRSDCRG